MCKIRMASLTSADIAKYRDRMKALGYAPATIVRRLNLIQTIIEHARREWRIHLNTNPAQMVKRPAGADRKRDRVFAPGPDPNAASGRTDGLPGKSEEERLLAACDNDSNPWLGPIVRFAILSAMRQGEIVGLRWSDIDLESGTVWVTREKDGVASDVRMRDDLRAQMARHGPQEPHRRVFRFHRGGATLGTN